MKGVAITGIGLLTALGTGAGPTWSALLDGTAGVRKLQAYDPSALRTRIGGEIDELRPRDHITDRRSLRNMTRSDQLGAIAATLAMGDAARTVDDDLRDRAGLFLAGHKEISDPGKVSDAVLSVRAEDGTTDTTAMGTVGQQQIYPLFYVEGLQAAALFYISKQHNLRGTNTYFAGTGDAGLTAIIRAGQAIDAEEAALAVAGGFDDGTSWWNTTTFDRFHILTEQQDPTQVAPYAPDRDGAALGDGAAILVLESLDRAAARDDGWYAEVIGSGSAFDIDAERDEHGAWGPAPTGAATLRAVAAALDAARIPATDIDLVVTAGAGTPAGDRSEVAGLRAALGAHAEQVAATTPTPAAGHLIAGAGSLNAAVAALALATGTVPAVGNLVRVADECAGLHWVTGTAETTNPTTALALGSGAEGQVVAVLLRRPPDDRIRALGPLREGRER